MTSFYDATEISKLGLAKVGKNVLISRKASLYGPERIKLGCNVRIDDFCILSAGPDGIAIGNYVHVAAYTSLIGKCEIELGDFANLSSKVAVYSSSDDFSGEYMTNPMVPAAYTNVRSEKVRISRHVIVGTGATILPGVTIEVGCAIGAMSLVKDDCKAFGIYYGIPARLRGERRNQLLSLEQAFENENDGPTPENIEL